MGIQTEAASAPLDTQALRTAPEQSRARYPDHEGYIERDGVRVFYEVYGEGEPTVLLLPTWSIVRPARRSITPTSLWGTHWR